MVLLLSKDDRCRLYLMRLLVEGTLKKVAEAEGKDFGKVNHTSSINFSWTWDNTFEHLNFSYLGSFSF